MHAYRSKEDGELGMEGEALLLVLIAKSSRINWQTTGAESAELFGRSERKHRPCF